MQNNGINFQHSKCMRDCNLIDGECRLSDSGLSSDRPYGEASTVPLHPTKRPASNPPPISNQATKGSVIICVLSFGNQFTCCCHLYHMLILKCEYSENGFSVHPCKQFCPFKCNLKFSTSVFFTKGIISHQVFIMLKFQSYHIANFFNDVNTGIMLEKSSVQILPQ